MSPGTSHRSSEWKATRVPSPEIAAMPVFVPTPSLSSLASDASIVVPATRSRTKMPVPCSGWPPTKSQADWKAT